MIIWLARRAHTIDIIIMHCIWLWSDKRMNEHYKQNGKEIDVCEVWTSQLTARQSFLISSIDFCSMYKQIKRTNCDCYESERHIQAIKGMFYLHSMHPKRICIDSSVLYLLFTLSLSLVALANICSSSDANSLQKSSSGASTWLFHEQTVCFR